MTYAFVIVSVLPKQRPMATLKSWAKTQAVSDSFLVWFLVSIHKFWTFQDFIKTER